MGSKEKLDVRSPNRFNGGATHSAAEEGERLKSLKEHALRVIGSSGPHWNSHLIAVLRRQSLSRILYYNDLYSKVVSVPGVICEFGVQWGATMSLLASLRGIYEPYNYGRTIVGFDTFTGFPAVAPQDGERCQAGDYASSSDHGAALEEILDIHESFSPIPHIKKYEIVRGDACETFPRWLDENPASLIAMAILDFDIYEPTKVVLERIVPRLTRGSVIAFDELSCPYYPGETAALMDTLGIGRLRLRRNPHQPWCAYAIWE